MDRNSYLDGIIETGEGYQYGNTPSRPVMENTIQDIESTGLVEEVLMKSLKIKVYDIG